MTEGYDLMEALDRIDPSDLDYEQWLAVGAALHHEGYPSSVWRDWSMRDPSRFNERDFKTKWASFGHETGKPVTGGTIVKLARDAGWKPERPHHALAWDAVIGGHGADEPPIVDATMVGDYDVDVRPMYSTGHGRDELRAFIDALFEDSEVIGYVTNFTTKTDEKGAVKVVPGDRGVYTRTAGELKADLAKGMEYAIGATHDESGAWIRFNPLDGSGVGNANVTTYRFALVESDDMPIGKFAEIVRQLNLPVAAMVHSGGKSLHAIVHIDAEDANTYRDRVETLYARCAKNGISVDKANKNPSRLCRMPGVMRNGNRQYLAGLAQGAADWDEWDEWYANETDELPDADPLDIDLDGERPAQPEELIKGILRIRDKMLLSGPSKAGKSFALMELCVALAEGGEWFGWQCRKSKVLYVNLELTASSCRARFYDVFRAMGKTNVGDVIPWNLKGHGKALSSLKKALVRRVKKTGAEVIIIDPIYKVMMGDESSAKDISEFTNTLDEVIEESGASLIYCHHHSKGYQGEKRSIDRASGSGVFGRDADAIVDMIELDPDDEARVKRVNAKQCRECMQAAWDAGFGVAWTALGNDVETVGLKALEEAGKLLDEADYKALVKRFNDIDRKSAAMTAWRIEATLREFERPAPVFAWFDWPLHVIDGELSKSREAGAEQPRGSGSGSGRAKKTTSEKKNEAIAEAVQSCNEDGEKPTRANVFERLRGNGFKKPSRDTFDKWTTADKENFEWCEWKAVEKDGSWLVEKQGGA